MTGGPGARDVLDTTIEDGVATLTLTDAERMNSFDPVLLANLHQTFRGLIEDGDVRAMVLTGSGRAFSAGADVALFRHGIEAGTVSEWILLATAQLHPLMALLHRCAKPLVAAVNGVAAGGGLGLALVADSRIGSPQARFAAGYFGIGASPDGGSTWLMPRIIGAQRTRRFFFDNEVMDAKEALACGLLDDVVEADELLDAAVARARLWGRWARHSREATKRLLDAQHSSDLETQLELERGLIAAAGGTADFREGVTAFLDKRPPRFQ